MKLAEACGSKGFLANGPSMLEFTLKENLTLDVSVLIEVPVGRMPTLVLCRLRTQHELWTVIAGVSGFED